MRISTFDDYQQAATETIVYPAEYAIFYPSLGLAGEAGEVVNKVKKLLRDYHGVADDYHLYGNRAEQIAEELGDVLWYVAALCNDLELNMGDVARGNIEKLKGREERGTIEGEGDDR